MIIFQDAFLYMHVYCQLTIRRFAAYQCGACQCDQLPNGNLSITVCMHVKETDFGWKILDYYADLYAGGVELMVNGQSGSRTYCVVCGVVIPMEERRVRATQCESGYFSNGRHQGSFHVACWDEVRTALDTLMRAKGK